MLTLQLPDLNLDQIAASGQCFTWTSLSPGRYGILAFGRYLEAAQQGDCFTFSCDDDEFSALWRDYFDLGRDYGAIKAAVDAKDSYLTQAIRFGDGVRVLKQDLWEVMVSFLISQNSNIGRITNSIHRLCARYGERRPSPVAPGGFYDTFPRPDDLARAALEDLTAAGLGYRAKYLQALADSMSGDGLSRLSEALAQTDDEAAEAALMELYGIGKKVADCICLFGLHRIDFFPVDTHIRRLFAAHYPAGFPYKRYRGFLGILQQYLFYYDLRGSSPRAKRDRR